MARLLRVMFSRLLVAMVTLSLASTTWHGVAVGPNHGPAAQAHATQVGHAHGAYGQADHKHSAAGNIQTATQKCCHPACTMAVILVPTCSMQAFPLSAPLRVTRDPMPELEGSSGPDRPPKAS